MKIDMELVRQILTEIQNRSDGYNVVDVEIESYKLEIISYHIGYLAKAGLLEALASSTFDYVDWLPIDLTWQGREFLDAAQNETVWNKTKDMVKEKGGSLPFEVMKELLVAVAKSMVGLG